MSIFTDNTAISQGDWSPGAETNAPAGEFDEAPDRRETNRFKTAFRPGCIIIGERVVLGMIRNMSRHGVMIEVEEPLREGQRLSYFWDEHRLVSARVIWSDGNRHGLENDVEAPIYDTRHTYRSVRVPCTLEAEIWANGERQRREVANLSLGGMRVRRLEARPGNPLTIAMAGVELYNADVRWNDGGEAGIRFAERLTRSQLSAILTHESVRFGKLIFD
ncbi:PilZ domain-containing protein [Erythrobacter sp.]|jgi:hypothetical protein|uniref:PilZ domain-containing protein n=1 Tax=Erythrobacter sp. TaxID=1042 RepID=UPI002E9ED47B|nr:PilZ domain-containing protein [Erythrobacter sp.]